MLCRNCEYPKKEHIGPMLICIGVNAKYVANLENVQAEIIYTNDTGVAVKDGPFPYILNGRQVVRLDNKIDYYLRKGYTNVSLNIL